MKIVAKMFVAVLIVSVSLVGYSQPASAAAAPGGKFPEKPITFIVPFGPGGSTDVLARTIANVMKENLPQPIIVVNRPGGGGAVGVTEVVNAKPDGYTLGVVSNSALVFPHVQDLGYKSSADLQPIIAIVSTPLTLYSNTKAPWKNLEEFVAAAKAKPGKLSVAMGSMGGVPQLSLALFMEKSGIKVNMVPMSSDAEGVAQILGGHIDAGLVQPPVVLGHVKAGTIKFLALLADERYYGCPDVPSFAELGYKDAYVNYYHSIFGPKGMPEPVLKILHDSFKKVLVDEAIKKVITAQGFIPYYRSTADLTKQMAADDKLFGDLVKKLKMKQ